MRSLFRPFSETILLIYIEHVPTCKSTSLIWSKVEVKETYIGVFYFFLYNNVYKLLMKLFVLTFLYHFAERLKNKKIQRCYLFCSSSRSTMHYLKARVHVKAVLTSFNTAFLPISQSRFKRHLISLLISLTTVWRFCVKFWAFWRRDIFSQRMG